MAEQVISISQFRGIKEKADTEIPDNYASDCLNVRLDRETEAVSTRAGYAKLNSAELVASEYIRGLMQYLAGSTKRLIAVSKQTMAYWNTGTSAWTSISTGLTASGDYYADHLGSLMIITDGVTVPWKYNGTTLAALGGSPYRAKYVLVYKNYVLLFNIYDAAWYGSRMKVSGLAAPETWPTDSDSTLDFNPNDGDEITGAVKFTDKDGISVVRVFKERSAYTLFGDNPATFAVYPYVVDEGAVSQRSIVTSEGALYWCGRKGIYRDGLRISDDIKDTVGTFNQANATKISGVAWEDTIRWTVPTGDNTVPDKILIYYPRLDTWTIDNNIPIQIMSVITTASTPTLYGGANALGYVHTLDSGTTDNTGAISSYWQSKDFGDFGKGLLYRDKWWKRFAATMKATGTDYNINFQYGINGRTLCTASGKSLYDASNAYVTPEWYLPLTGDGLAGTGKTLRFKMATNAATNPWTMYAASLFAEVCNY